MSKSMTDGVVGDDTTDNGGTAPEDTLPSTGVEGDGGPDPVEPSSPVRPDYIPEKFWDADKGEVRLEGLVKSYTELEKNRVNPDKLKEQWEQDRLAVRPEAPDGYQLPQDERFDAEALAASPIVEIWRNAAYEAGLPQEAFEQRLIQYADTFVQQTQAKVEQEVQALGENAQERIEAAGKWAQANFKDDEFDAIAQIATTAAGVRVLERFMKSMREAGMETLTGEGDAITGEDDYATIMKLMDSKEYYSAAHRDPKVVARVEAFFKKQAK